MENDKDYQKLLKKMYLIELLGDSLYENLALKEKNGELRKIYVRLSDNERETGENIEKEIYKSSRVHRHWIVVIASFLFRIIPNKVLSNFLKNILRKRMYSQWFELYNEYNSELWQLLVEHEELQHELLSPYWGNEN